MPPPNAPATGPTRLGAYELVERIASGGMAEVYVARRTGAYGFRKRVALKRILPQLAREADFVAMFIDEARICARLSHPNLVEVFDFGEDGGELFMAMELVEGTTCAKLIRAAAARGETLPLEDALYVVLSVLRGLAYAHDATDEQGTPLGLVHRDVSPGNVLVSRSGVVKLGDFGIVRASDLDRRTDHGQLKGKLGYMSPEQVLGRDLDARSDLFVVGIVLAELVTGFPLFAAGGELDVLCRIRDANVANFELHAGHVPAELRAVVRHALAREPNERFASAAAFAEALEDIVRRRRMSIGSTRLSASLEFLGLVPHTVRSGEYRLNVSPGQTVPAGPAPHESLPPSTVPAGAQSLEARSSDAPPPANAQTSYRVRSAEGNETEAMSLARTLEFFVAGNAPAGALVSRSGGAFVVASNVPELARVVASSSHRWWSVAPEAAGRGWPVDPATLPLRLFALALAGATGVLHATDGGRRKKLFFDEGRVAYVSSNERDEMLGTRLIARGLVLPMELEMALALAPRYGGRLGDALVGVGIVRPMELFAALYEQARTRVASLLSWREGELVFAPGVRTTEDVLPEPLAPFDLFATATLHAYSDAELRGLLAPVLGAVLSPGERATGVPARVLRLPAAEAEVLQRVDGTRSARVLLRELPGHGVADESEVLRAVFVGLCAGAIVAPGWPSLVT